MKRILTLLALIVSLSAIGGCVYGTGYYTRPGVVYDDGTSYSYSDNRSPYGYDYYAAPGYYYNPWCCYVSPWIGLGFYGSYYYGGHGHYREGHGGHGHWHGSHRRGGHHDGGGHHGHHRGH